MLRIWLTLAALLVLCSCTNTEFTASTSVPQRPPYAGPVAVLQQLPSGEYEVLGTIIVTEKSAADPEKMLELLVVEAAERGATVVVLQGKPITVQTTYSLQTRLAGTLLWQ